VNEDKPLLKNHRPKEDYEKPLSERLLRQRCNADEEPTVPYILKMMRRRCCSMGTNDEIKC
jgi:hypothetical protein